MKKILCTCLLALFFLGCSASDPTVSSTSISSDDVVTGQRVLAQVYAISDNPPMTYAWSADGGRMEITDESSYAAFWVAPEETGTYTITCTISDKEDKQTSRSFTVNVRIRQLDGTLVSGNVLSLAKQTDSTLGGIWAAVEDSYIRYLSSRSNQDTTWQKNFSTFIARMDPYTFEYTIWGVESPGKDIEVLTTGSESTLECTTCTDSDVIRTMSLDVLDSNILWVGADSGLHYYNPTVNPDAPWGTYAYFTGRVNELFEGPDCVYAATDSGIYKLLAQDEPLYDGDTCAVSIIEQSVDPLTVTVWAVAGSVVEKDGVPLAAQPDDVACSIDVDPSGNIWCGKYWYDGSAWHLVPGLDEVNIVRSIASNEGLIYLLSDSGVLYRW
ncbi:MAG TPA: hypothetical protein PK600_01635 [Deltaproteobacteria bacterium]|nr:hypothetical protein [Deltaproteobacteria bacterium]